MTKLAVERSEGTLRGRFVNPKSAKCSGRVMKPSRYHKFTILSGAGGESEIGGTLFISKAVKKLPAKIILVLDEG